MANSEVLNTTANHYDSRSVIRIEGDYYLLTTNGGTIGAWSPAPAGKFGCERIDRTEARAQLLANGLTPEDVLRLTTPDNVAPSPAAQIAAPAPGPAGGSAKGPQ